MTATVTPDPARQAVINACMEHWDVGDDKAEWPNNIISRHAVVYSDGTIARRADTVTHQIDPTELALCMGLSQEVARLMHGVEVGMGSEATSYFVPFFIAAPQASCVAHASAQPQMIDDDLIRTCFGGTLFPPVTITVEPFAENTAWWQAVLTDGAESEPAFYTPWKALSVWFTRQPAFIDTAFVSIGDATHLQDLPETSWPPGTELVGSALPRLALGLTPNGSLTGLFGYTVQT